MWCPKFVAQPDGANLPVINAIFQDNAWGRTVIVDNLEKKRCEDNDVFASCTWRADFNSFTPALLYVEHTYNSISKFSFCSLNGSTILRLLWRNNVSDAPPSHSIRSHWSFFFVVAVHGSQNFYIAVVYSVPALPLFLLATVTTTQPQNYDGVRLPKQPPYRSKSSRKLLSCSAAFRLPTPFASPLPVVAHAS